MRWGARLTFSIWAARRAFFSLSLASKGATIVGIDFQQENINVCRALAEENPDFAAEFRVGRIEEVIAALEEGEFDLAIGLSVFHHIVHLHGIDEVKRLLSRLADVTQAVILEPGGERRTALLGRFSAGRPA
ncbi:class I SAM-dependent methyltransferase [Klebsiella variicola subsp. variicola]|nr:class I SAM-dependent methyltransferase [Klebsiella variicola subsp. variicola]